MDYLRDDEYLGRAVIHLKGNNRVLSRGDHIEERNEAPLAKRRHETNRNDRSRVKRWNETK